jgi:hypothetical protein
MLHPLYLWEGAPAPASYSSKPVHTKHSAASLKILRYAEVEQHTKTNKISIHDFLSNADITVDVTKSRYELFWEIT